MRPGIEPGNSTLKGVVTLPIRPTHHVGTANGTRTHTEFLPPAPQAGASAYSTIAAYLDLFVPIN